MQDLACHLIGHRHPDEGGDRMHPPLLRYEERDDQGYAGPVMGQHPVMALAVRLGHQGEHQADRASEVVIVGSGPIDEVGDLPLDPGSVALVLDHGG